MKYLYGCPACEAEQTIERSIHEPAGDYICENCGYHMIRVFEAPPVHFKGGGFASNER